MHKWKGRLQTFGISLDALSVAGGTVLVWIGFSTLVSKPPQPKARSGRSRGKRLTDSLILFAASPGTITGVITLSVVHTRLDLPVPALVAIAVAMAVTWLVMVRVARMGRQGRTSFVRDTVMRFMRLIWSPWESSSFLPESSPS